METDEQREVAPPILVPGPDVPWSPDIERFALSFDGYERLGEACGTKANRYAKRYFEKGWLPRGMDDLRGCLFFEQRRWRHFQADPMDDEGYATYLRALLDRIRELSGGQLPGPPDIFW